MTMGPVFPPTYNPDPDANKYTQLLWSHLNTWIQKFVGNHHVNHEPGGKDFVEMPLGGLKDVLIYHPETAQVLGYTMSGTVPIWRNMEATALGGTITYSGGTTTGQAFFEAAGSLLPGVVPGPTNLMGGVITITQVRFSSDGASAGSESVSGQSFSFGAGGGTDDNAGLTRSWGDGTRLSITLDSVGSDATYVAADVVFKRVT